MSDLIGDIHGHAEPLQRLLQKMGYELDREGIWSHAERQVIFLGDFVDRGQAQVESVRIAKTMVEAGSALAIMGNHEFNAVCWATRRSDESGEFLRPHSGKNDEQHHAYLDQVGEGSALHREHLEWFRQLPLYLDLEGLRVIHACWHLPSLEALRPFLDAEGRLREDAWPSVALKGAPGFEALETLLKGWEIPLPDGVHFHDEQRNPRHHIRTRWWQQAGRLTYRDLAIVPPDVIADIPHQPVPDDVMPGYSGGKPLFVGHYWLSGNPAPLTPQIACLDYSIAASTTHGDGKGKLCAYRWQGETALNAANMVWVAG